MTFGFKEWRVLFLWLLLLSFAYLSFCKNQSKVHLSWRRHGDRLCIVCDVKNLSLGVSFEDPHGNTRGHCTAPIPHTVAGHCDSHLKQNIYNETTVLTIDRVDCENGLWKCSHGENTNEYATASVSVSVDTKEQKPKGSQVHGAVSIYSRYKCTLLPFVCGYVIALFLFILSRLLFSKTQNKTGHQCVNVCRKKLSTKLSCMIVVLPFVIIWILPLLFMLIPGICEGSWWILVTIVVAILTGVFRAVLGEIPDRIYNLVQRGETDSNNP